MTLTALGLHDVLPRKLVYRDSPPRFPSRPAELPIDPPENILADGLQNVNSHPRDEHLIFTASDHAYFWRGKRVARSATQLVHEFTNEFSENQVISSMQRSTNWPRPGYLKSALSERQKAGLAQLKGTGQLLRAFQQEERDELQICRLAHRLRATAPEDDAIAELVAGLGLSESEIREKWAQAREDGAKEGTWMHAQFEHLLNGGSLPSRTEEVALLAQFLRSQPGMTAYRTEWRIYAEEEDVAGSIDYVAERPDGSKVIVDWKRTKRTRLNNEAFGKFMRRPLCSVPDCTLWHYRLQLNAYRFILEKYYGQIVSSMYIVGTNPDNGDQPYVDEVPRMQTETQALFQHCANHRHEIAAKVRRAESHVITYRQCRLVQANLEHRASPPLTS